MRTLDLHRDVGAYALGVLDASDAFRFEDHLMVCPQCTLLLADFGGVKAQLDRYARQTPAEVAPYAVAGPELLAGLLDRTADGRRKSRRRRLALAAVAAVLVVGGPLAVLGASSGTDPGDTATVRWSASDRASGTSAVVTTAEAVWGTDVGLELVRPGVSEVCALIAVGLDGSRQTVMTWASHARDGERLVTRGGAALRPAEISRFEVRASDGRVLVTIGG
ncbi:zf-HC2 domain-containing protein [Streptomyces corynorhini]|uniref:Zf-HC2 domain-containing protein n=1 Tax=Streptomyces corynorhini TaxID=2282652 RepID=A0A370B130_9ACTN|nr:zf-HC2 domain-containing protein [Streptomyces corynorhini]RDG35530.1 zf-HC2 domain-containing protein [Streptomyces corynorhini]